MAIYSFPVNNGNQKFNINIDGILYFIRIKWNDAAKCWSMDFYDSENNALAIGLPILSGIDILGQHHHIGIRGKVFLSIKEDAKLDSFSTNFILCYSN